MKAPARLNRQSLNAAAVWRVNAITENVLKLGVDARAISRLKAIQTSAIPRVGLIVALHIIHANVGLLRDSAHKNH